MGTAAGLRAYHPGFQRGVDVKVPQLLTQLVSLGVALGLVVPSLAVGSYQCRVSGALRAVPCAENERADGARASDCCNDDQDGGAASAVADCCRSITFEAPSLAATLTVQHLTTHLAPRPPIAPEWQHALASAREGPLQDVTGPPGEPPRFVLHCRFLC